ncbi:MAG: DUF3501 family protein [Candidatus Neomarinimicrobiota bacterium]|nr:DUF3501 family protein [Candidatus Neomarinimicrobiota bacterium]
MKPIVISDLMNIIEYEKVRNDYRSELMDYKKMRRISLGPNITITFENRKTMKFQIQEMMRAERMVHDNQIQEEIDVYNSLLPLVNGLSATLFIEVTDEDQIRPVLNQFIGLTEGKAVYFEIEDQKIYAEFETGREESNKISSVHYIEFNFNATAKAAFLDNPQSVKLIINYKNYTYSETINEEMHKSWSEDLLSS